MNEFSQMADSNSQTTQTLPITSESHPEIWQLLQPSCQRCQGHKFIYGGYLSPSEGWQSKRTSCPDCTPQQLTPVPTGWDKV